jgi:hypothetical protein
VRTGCDGAKRREKSRASAALDALGHLLAFHVTSDNEEDRAQVGKLAMQEQQIIDKRVELAYVDQGHTDEATETAATEIRIQLEVVKHAGAKRGLVVSRRELVIERGFSDPRFRRWAHGCERLATNFGAFHFLAFVCLMIGQSFGLLA